MKRMNKKTAFGTAAAASGLLVLGLASPALASGGDGSGQDDWKKSSHADNRRASEIRKNLLTDFNVSEIGNASKRVKVDDSTDESFNDNFRDIGNVDESGNVDQEVLSDNDGNFSDNDGNFSGNGNVEDSGNPEVKDNNLGNVDVGGVGNDAEVGNVETGDIGNVETGDVEIGTVDDILSGNKVTDNDIVDLDDIDLGGSDSKHRW